MYTDVFCGVRLQAQRMAHMQMEFEKRPNKKSPIAEIVSMNVKQLDYYSLRLWHLFMNCKVSVVTVACKSLRLLSDRNSGHRRYVEMSSESETSDEDERQRTSAYCQRSPVSH